MFITPPPPQYPDAPRVTAAAISNIFAETNNTLNRASDGTLQLILGEGTYTFRDELVLAQPPPHPTDVPIPSNNPLDTSPRPISAGSTLTTTSPVVRPRPTFTNGHGPVDRRESAWSVNNIGLVVNTDDAQDESVRTSNETISKDSKDVKRKKPKTGMVKSSSSFLSRVLISDTMAKRLTERDSRGLFAITHAGRALQWLDLSSDDKADYLIKLYFTKTNILCHDINTVTRSSTHMDVIVGFSTGDIIWFEPFSQKYTRLNKNGLITDQPVVAIKWMPDSENLFITAHSDGSLTVFDKEKDDAVFVPDNFNTTRWEIPVKMWLAKSIHHKSQKTNPVAVYRISMKSPHALEFSPDGGHLAVVSDDGNLRIVDMDKEIALDIYRSFYGGLTTLAWSPDGRYIVTGGQDDLVSVWSFPDRALIARCHGHDAWVTHVQFDPWRCDDRGYRFGSVGEDCKLLLWDFSLGMLRKPKLNSAQHRGSVASSSVQKQIGQSSSEDGVFHLTSPQSTIPTMRPIMSKQVDSDPLSSLAFEEDCIITTSKEGHIKTWDRPKA